MCIVYLSLVFLDEITEWQWLDGGDDTIVSGCLEEICFFGELWCALEVDLDARLGSFGLGGLVVLLSLQDFLLALGVSNVLNANMNTLLDDSSINQLVDTHTDGRFCNVEDDSCSSVVSLVGHTLVDRRIGENVDIVTHLYFH